MAVVDFRSGGFVGAQPRQVRDYPYGQDPRFDGDTEDWQEEARWDEQRYATHAGDGLLAQGGSVISRVGRFTQYLGALISVGLMVMLLVWGYKLVVRDVSGVPVIRAIEGEARSAPDNPGGELTAHTGLAVNSVAAGTNARPTNQVAIAPDSTALGDEDVAMGELGATARQPSHEVDLPLATTSERVVARPDAEAAAAAAAAEAAEVQAAADRLAALSENPTTTLGETPANEAVTDLEGEAAGTDAINAALTEAAAAAVPAPAAVKVSARPTPRPRRAAPAVAAAAPAPAAASQQAAVTQTAAAAPAPAPAPKVAPSAISSGAPMVQIGAFDSNSLADGEWGRVSRKFGALFAGKAQVIQKAESGGRTFWRLRAAGFESRDEARRFCAALIAEGIDCIPATAK